MTMIVKTFTDEASGTLSHVIYNHEYRQCAIVDPVLGYDSRSGKTDTHGADAIISFVREKNLEVEWLLETHMHADHLSGSAYLRAQLGGKIAASKHVREVQKTFGAIYNLSPDYYLTPGLFDYFFEEDEVFEIAGMRSVALYVPGHTPADTAYYINEEAAFVGDTLFAPDLGTARCDFPGGSATRLYRSAQRLLSLPCDTLLYLCHDYPPSQRSIRAITSVSEQRQSNIHVNGSVSLNDFVVMREARDSTLPMPNLLLPSLQVNIRAGVLPDKEANGTRYLRIPLDES
ncbi:MBL fold metallo-hydrolase [Pseudomonas putida]|uniref:MBL fold metallo-hydrolase n=1 Tax=Pseudomonas putida TaxID=303 RepID=UPI0003693F9C|nr:MBL fold metallo-hydrolase [Pseudomonas putida]